jgi:hypothetical protein
MENITIELPLTRELYREILMRKFGVSPLKAKAYYNEHRNDDEFVNIKDILKPNTKEDVLRCLALLYILTYGESEDRGIYMERQYYNKYTQAQRFKYTYTADEMIGYIKKYKLFLITALRYDDDFFEEVAMWYREIFKYDENKPGADRIVDFPKPVDVPAASSRRTDSGEVNAPAAASGIGMDFKKFERPIKRVGIAASGTDTRFNEFDSPIELEDGVLHILGDTKNRIRFQFEFKDYPFGEDGESVETAPYGKRVFFTTTEGSEEPEGNGFLDKANIYANNPRHKKLVIQSEPIENIAYTKGIFIWGWKNE